ncbi:MAG: DNA polymerase IV [Nitrospirae bacterium]|nr:DNA polymerase IV [Nitrospirota bacterium]
MQRTILHIDMDAFFASVEQQANPALRGKPVAVCGAGARTVVMTASYEARAWGVRTGMSLPEAKALCPSLIVVAGHHEWYTETCRRLTAICRDYTPNVELFSIDEAFLDVTDSLLLFGGAEAIARAIKTRVRHHLGLTASVGIAPNKLLAKLASGLKKPDGLVVVGPAEIPPLMERLPVQELCGIGPSTARQLAEFGITTCGALGRAPLALLVGRFGVFGRRLSAMGRGEDDAPVRSEGSPAAEAAEAKSVGHSMTLDRNVWDQERLERYLLELTGMVGRRLRRHALAGRVVTVTLRYADFTTFTRQQRSGHPMNDDGEIYRAARAILRAQSLTQAVRLVGVSVSGLVGESAQESLFDDWRRRRQLLAALDAVHNRHGDGALMWGELLAHNRRQGIVISPAWRPQGLRDYS